MLADSQLCFVGVNTNSSFPVTGGNTEASPRLFQANLRPGLHRFEAVKVSDVLTLFHPAVFCILTLIWRVGNVRFPVIFQSHTTRLPVRYAQRRTVGFSHEASISGARSAFNVASSLHPRCFIACFMCGSSPSDNLQRLQPTRCVNVG